MMLLGVLLVAGTAASIDVEFTPNKLIVTEAGTAEFVITDVHFSEDVRIEVQSVGIEVDAPDTVYVEPGVSNQNYITVGVDTEGTYLVTLIADASDGDATATLIVTTQADQGINVVATPKDYDGDDYDEDVHVYVHEQGNSDVAIPDAEVEIDGEYVGKTNENGILRANDFVRGEHEVNATFSEETDATEFEAEVPPVVYMDIDVEIDAFNGSEYNDANIYATIYFDETPVTGAGAAVDMGEASNFLTRGQTDDHGRIQAVDMPMGDYKVWIEWSGSIVGRHFTIRSSKEFFSFGNMSPDSVILIAEPWADDNTWRNDINITVIDAYGPQENVTVKIPIYDEVWVEKTNDLGMAHFHNLPDGDFTAQAYENGSAIDGADDEFTSDGRSPQDWAIDITRDVLDDDGDGYHDDVLITVNNSYEKGVNRATIWIDGTRIGLTNEDGRLYVPNLDYGVHNIVAEKVVLAAHGMSFETSMNVTTFGQPDIKLEQNIVDMIVEPGDTHQWYITFTRKISDTTLIGKIYTSLSNGEEVVEEKMSTAFMPVNSIITSFRVDIDIPEETGDHILEVQITAGDISVWLEPVHLYVYYTDLDTVLTCPETFLYGQNMDFNLRVTNLNKGDAVMFDPDHLPSYLMKGRDVADLQTWDGHHQIVPSGASYERTITYNGKSKLYPDGYYSLKVYVSQFDYDEIGFEIKEVQSSEPDVFTREDAANVAIASFSGIMIMFAVFKFEATRLPLLALFFPLYTRMKRNNVLDHFLRGRIYEYVKVNPGVNFSQILRYFDLNNGTLTYHLNVLEREKYVKSIRDGVYRRYYLTGTHVDEEHLSDVKHRILKVVHDFPGISQSNIAKLIGASRRLVNYHIKALEGQEVIEITREGRNSHVYLRKEIELD